MFLWIHIKNNWKIQYTVKSTLSAVSSLNIWMLKQSESFKIWRIFFKVQTKIQNFWNWISKKHFRDSYTIFMQEGSAKFKIQLSQPLKCNMNGDQLMFKTIFELGESHRNFSISFFILFWIICTASAKHLENLKCGSPFPLKFIIGYQHMEVSILKIYLWMEILLLNLIFTEKIYWNQEKFRWKNPWKCFLSRGGWSIHKFRFQILEVKHGRFHCECYWLSWFQKN